MHEDHKIIIYCLHAHKQRPVYIRTLDYDDIHWLEFNGCDADFGHLCCATCREKAIELFSQDHNISEYTV